MVAPRSPWPRVPRLSRCRRGEERHPLHTPWYCVTPKGLLLVALVLAIAFTLWAAFELQQVINHLTEAMHR